MPCQTHAFHHEWCGLCREAESRFEAEDRHHERMKQADRHHRDRMNAQRKSQSSSNGLFGGGAPLRSGPQVPLITRTDLRRAVILIVAAPVIVLILGVVMFAANVITLAVQGAFVFLLFGGIATAITYAVGRSKSHDLAFQAGTYDKALPQKGRVLGFYATLGPISQKAAKVGLIVGTIMFVLSVLF